MKVEYDKVYNLVCEAKRILVISHRKPDSDTLGAAIAVKIWLTKEFKDLTLACVNKPAKVFSFLPYIHEFKEEFNLNNFDLIFIVDAGASYMTNFHLKYENFLTSGVPIINIDHHSSNDNFGLVNIVDSSAPSTTVIIYRMFKYLNVQIDKEIANCLLSGIYGDTGSFMHSNTTKECYEISADLVQKGGEFVKISKALFKSNSVLSMKLWGQVLNKAFVTPTGVVMAVVDEDDYLKTGSGPENLTGVIDYLSMVPNAKFAVLINEDRYGNIKGSLRTRTDDVDLSKIASEFGGGGHPKASGFSVQGKLQKDVRYTIVSQDMSKKTLEF